jgi:hypothetical protein
VQINTAQKCDFVKKWYVIGHLKCHFVFQHTKIHEEEINFSKIFLVAGVCLLFQFFKELIFLRSNILQWVGGNRLIFGLFDG